MSDAARPWFSPDPAAVLPPDAAHEAAEVLREIREALAHGASDADPARNDAVRPYGAGQGPLAFDLDDTIVTGTERSTRRPQDVPVTRWAIAWVLGRLLEDGERILIVTGRDDEALAWQDMRRALDEVAGRAVPEGLVARIGMRCGGAWAGTKIAVRRKTQTLQETGARLLVGDLDHLDGRAARQAGIPFIDVGPHWTKRRGERRRS